MPELKAGMVLREFYQKKIMKTGGIAAITEPAEYQVPIRNPLSV